MAKNGFKIMDSDMHTHEPWDLWLNYIDPAFKDRAPIGTSKDPVDMNTTIEGDILGAFLSNQKHLQHEEEQARLEISHSRSSKYMQEGIDRGFDSVSQVNAMEVEGLDVANLYPSRGMVVAGVDYEDEPFADAIAKAYNNWLADFCSESPARLKGVAMILCSNIDNAVAEVRRTREELNFVGIYLHPNPIRGRNWHSNEYDRLWAVCQELDMAVTFHETFKCNLPQAIADRFYDEPDRIWTMGHVACHPIEQMYAALCMCAGGILEKFPGIRVAHLECNSSWLPFWLWRMDEHHEHREEQASKYLNMLPSEYFKRQCFAVIDPDEEPSKYAIDWVGDDNFVFSTDYPHPDSIYPFATDSFLKLPLSEEAKKKVMWDNCTRLYSLSV